MSPRKIRARRVVIVPPGAFLAASSPHERRRHPDHPFEASTIMKHRRPLSLRVPLALAQAIALALGCAAPALPASAQPSPQTRVVQNCEDSGAGSLRETYAGATDGDIVDLSKLACSTVTLTGGPVTSGVYPGTVTLRGSPQHRTTVSGNHASRVIVHDGDAIRVENLTIAAGFASDFAGGGCILSEGDVTLVDSTVTDCEVSTLGGTAAIGGAVRAKYTASLLHATISDSRAHAAAAAANGGGVHAAYLIADRQSSVSGNSAGSADGHPARGGGAFSLGGLRVHSTTFSGNKAGSGGAIYLGRASGNPSGQLINSTISGNVATDAGGGVMSANSLVVYNSTITMNRSGFDFGAGLYLGDLAVLSSSIVANNTSGGGLNAADVGGEAGTTIFGENNLIVASTLSLPDDTISDDPGLGPLADNGGGVLTHALLTGSPAIDHGANVLKLDSDQRDSVCAGRCQLAERSVGAATDIGAFEHGAPDRIFGAGFDLED